jgi:hypothetical protein
MPRSARGHVAVIDVEVGREDRGQNGGHIVPKFACFLCCHALCKPPVFGLSRDASGGGSRIGIGNTDPAAFCPSIVCAGRIRGARGRAGVSVGGPAGPSTTGNDDGNATDENR